MTLLPLAVVLELGDKLFRSVKIDRDRVSIAEITRTKSERTKEYASP